MRTGHKQVTKGEIQKLRNSHCYLSIHDLSLPTASRPLFIGGKATKQEITTPPQMKTD